MGLHGLPLLVAEGRGHRQHQQERMGITLAKSQALADLLEEVVR